MKFCSNKVLNNFSNICYLALSLSSANPNPSFYNAWLQMNHLHYTELHKRMCSEIEAGILKFLSQLPCNCIKKSSGLTFCTDNVTYFCH